MKVVFASILALGLTLGTSGCASNTAQVSDFSNVVKTEAPVFLSSAAMLSCKVDLAMVSFFSWDSKSSKCHRDIELMVFAAERVVSKFELLLPPEEVANLVSETIRDLRPIGDSGFGENCSTEGLRTGVSDACMASLNSISGAKQYAMEDAWRSLDAWQPYF